MDLREAEALLEELSQFVAGHPGHNPEGLRRVSEICWKFRNSEGCDHLLADRLAEARRMFEHWFSARSWQQWGQDGARARAMLGSDLDRVRQAVAACFRD